MINETPMQYVRRRVTSGQVNLSELSRKSGISHWTIRNLRNGRAKQMMAETCERLAIVLFEQFPESGSANTHIGTNAQECK